MSKLIGAALLAAAIVTPAFAHHAVNAQFNMDKIQYMTGTLSAFDNRAPHAFWSFVDKTTGETWKFESVSPVALRRAGLQLKQDIVVGTTYKIGFSPSRDPALKIGNISQIEINGHNLVFNENFITPQDGAAAAAP